VPGEPSGSPRAATMVGAYSRTVRARTKRLSALSIPIVDRFCVAFLYGRAGRLIAKNGGVRPGQGCASVAPYVWGVAADQARCDQLLTNESLSCRPLCFGYRALRKRRGTRKK
jgi:hypothetical protein